MTAFGTSLTRSSARLAAVAAAAALGLTGCAGTAPSSASSSGAPGPSATATAPGSASAAASSAGRQAEALAVHDAWAKASDGSMTGLFGTLENRSDAPLHVVSVTTAAAPRAELHETVADATGQTAMRRAADGFTIPAHGRLDLVPGGNHVMLMDLTGPVEAGQEVTVTLAFEDGSTLDVRATARPFTGAKESYHAPAGSGAASSAPADHAAMGHGTPSATAPSAHADH